jgi:hypothetical protein
MDEATHGADAARRAMHAWPVSARDGVGAAFDACAPLAPGDGGRHRGCA